MSKLPTPQYFQQIDWIIAITRGGLFPTAILTQVSNIRSIDTICMQSYQGKNQSEIQITTKNYDHIKDQNILLVDDLADSGKTLKIATEYLQKFSPKNIQIFVIFKKDKSIFEPDFYLQTRSSDAWINFKYDGIKMEDIISFLEK
jgi:hypoxanthine phosphoribosyltransferase